MSDSEDYEYEYESDAQFGDSEEELLDDAAIELENSFYEADDCALRSPGTAIELFLKVYGKTSFDSKFMGKIIEKESNQASSEKKWTLKALENVVKLCGRTKQEARMLEYTSKLLENMDAGTRNECSESIQSTLEAVNCFFTSPPLKSEVRVLGEVFLDSNIDLRDDAKSLKNIKLRSPLVSHEH